MKLAYLEADRCERLLTLPAGPGFSATSVSNTAGMPAIERQLYGTSTVKIFLLPGS
jgi:hypothetical protein